MENEWQEPRILRVKEQGIFRMTDIQRLGAECSTFPTFEVIHLSADRTRIVRHLRRYSVKGRWVIEFEEYSEGTIKRRREKPPIPLKEIYREIKRVTDVSGKTIARRKTLEEPLRWLLPTGK